MGLSFDTAKGDGVTVVFPFRFVGVGKGYIRESDIVVQLRTDNTLVWTDTDKFSLVTSNSISFGTAPETPTDGKVNIRIRRVMPKDEAYANWNTGQNYSDYVINNSFLQQLYTMHEVLDGFSGIMSVDLNMQGNKIINLATDLTDPNSVATIGALIEMLDKTTKVYEDTVVVKVEVDQLKLDCIEQVGLAKDEAVKALNEAGVAKSYAEASKVDSERAEIAANTAGSLVGEMKFYPVKDSSPIDRKGLVLPDGLEVPRVGVYSELWGMIANGTLPSVSESEWQSGTKDIYSTGDGSTTFRLPIVTKENNGLQPYIVYTTVGESSIIVRGQWDVVNNKIIGDYLNTKVTKDVPPVVETGRTVDGSAFLVTVGGLFTVNAEGERLFVIGDQIIWFGTSWVILEKGQVYSVNGKIGDVVLNPKDIGAVFERTLIGSEQQFPALPSGKVPSAMHVAKDGAIILRSERPDLFSWATDMELVIAESEWQAIKAASEGGAVAYYSDGDGSTTFRVPSVGTQGMVQRPIGSGSLPSDANDVMKGYGDAIRNIRGNLSNTRDRGFLKQTDSSVSGAFYTYTQEGGLMGDTAGGGNFRNGAGFDASRVVPTATENRMKFMWCSIWIYAGSGALTYELNDPVETDTNKEETLRLSRELQREISKNSVLSSRISNIEKVMSRFAEVGAIPNEE